MSLSRELQLHITQMQEIRSILNAMKNLAFMEIHKLQRFKTMQGQALATIENAALDFLDFYPRPKRCHEQPAHLCILLGAERGFCGDFNESLLKAIASQTYTGIIAVGSRLRLEGTNLEGANIAEEVPTIINRLLDTIGALADGADLTLVYHDSTHQISQLQLLPPFPLHQQAPHKGNPPLLNLAPEDFFANLVEHYLFAVLHEIFYISLMAENQRRLQHLEGAVKHLDDETVNLQRKSQIYRQEEITEEIEVILLNAENL